MRLSLFFVGILLAALALPGAAYAQEESEVYIPSDALIPNDPLRRTFAQVAQELADWNTAVAAAHAAGVVSEEPRISLPNEAPPGSPRWTAEREAYAAWVAAVQAFRDSGGVAAPGAETAEESLGAEASETGDDSPSQEELAEPVE